MFIYTRFYRSGTGALIIFQKRVKLFILPVVALHGPPFFKVAQVLISREICGKIISIKSQ